MSLFENRSKQEEEKKDLPRKRGRPRKHFSNICENIPMKNRTKAYTSKRMKIKKLYSRMIKSLDI